MKYFLCVCCLLALSRVAFADEAFPAFVTGQGATGSITGTELMPVIQGGVTTKDTLSGLKTYFQSGGGGGGGVPNVTVLSPIVGDNASAITTALSGANAVILSPGYYEVCSQVDIPAHRSLQGTDGRRQGDGNLVPSYPWTFSPTVVGSNGCPNSGNGSFANGQGYFHFHDFINISGFTIQGQRQIGGHNQINCVNAENAASIVITNMVLVDCYTAVDRLSSSTPGDNGSISQTAIVSFNAFTYPEHLGINCGTGSGGNGCADEHYTYNECEVPGLACIQMDGANSEIIGNRMEDGSIAIQGSGDNSTKSVDIIVANNRMSRIWPFLLTAPMRWTIVGNNMHGTEGPPSQPCFFMNGVAFGMVIKDNTCAYNFTTGFSIGTGYIKQSHIYGNYVPAGNDFADFHSASQILYNANSWQSSDYDTSFASGAGAGLEDFAVVHATRSLGAINDPVTGLNGVPYKLTEDNTTNAHEAFSATTNSFAGTGTVMGMYKAGSSGTRNAVFIASDGTNSVNGIFNQTTCASVATTTGGAGAVVSTSGIALGGGWCRVILSYSGLGASNVSLGIGLASGSTQSYAGDNASNNYFFDVHVLTSGSVAPGLMVNYPQ